MTARSSHRLPAIPPARRRVAQTTAASSVIVQQIYNHAIRNLLYLADRVEVLAAGANVLPLRAA